MAPEAGCTAESLRQMPFAVLEQGTNQAEEEREEAMSTCAICATPQKSDLFAAVTGEPVCSICKLSYIGGLPSTPQRIALARQMLGLKDGEFLEHDRGKEARRILNRRH